MIMDHEDTKSNYVKSAKVKTAINNQLFATGYCPFPKQNIINSSMS